MRDFSKLTNVEFHRVWDENNWESQEETHEFRKEIVKRHYATWEEINTKWKINVI